MEMVIGSLSSDTKFDAKKKRNWDLWWGYERILQI